jgi:type IV pilus assembly protein PilF
MAFFFRLILCLGPLFLLTHCASFSSSSTDPFSQEQDNIKKPNKTAANYNLQLGVAYLNNQNIKRAKEKFLLALQQAPNWPPALEGMGLYLETTGEPELAKAYYLKAIKLDPKTGRSHNNYGTFLCRQKHYPEAIEEFKLAVSDPAYLNTAEAYENAAMCAELIPEKTLAHEYYEKAYYRDPLRPLPLLKLAGYLYEEKTYEKASRYLDMFNEVSEPSAQSLWLEIEIARATGKTAVIRSNALLLKTRFPQSEAYQNYLKISDGN